jgi:hypothetical protein
MRSTAWIAFAGAALLVGATARAQVVGSFEGTIAARSGSVGVAAVFKQDDRLVSGTVALPGDLAAFGGEYLVTGKATRTRIKFSGRGGSGGGNLKGNLKSTGGTLAGKIRVKVPRTKALNGRATLTANPPVGDGTSCDAVYQANETLFDGAVMGALGICGTCHGTGLQAESTRLHVAPSNPLATARAVAPFVDAADPTASKLLAKPLNLIPHGGGVQIQAGSAQHQALQQWVGLIAAAQCN